MITGINSLAITGSITLYEIEIMHRDQCSSANFTGVSFKFTIIKGLARQVFYFYILLSGIKLEHRLTMVYPFTLQQLLHAAYWASIA